MIRSVILSFVLCYSAVLIAQDTESTRALIKEGVALHDEGNFAGAIAKYEQALAIDSANITAMAEKAMSLLAMKEYDNSIKTCEQAIHSNPDAPGLKFVYTTYANALDGAGKPEKAIAAYDEGIERFPDYYQLYFNKGITLSGLEKFDEALLSFNRATSLNPRHASSHNAIARLLSIANNDIPSLLAFGRFAILEPQGPRAEANFPYVQKIMKANVEKTGKKSVTINLDPVMLADVENKEGKPNNFSTTAMILSMTAALDHDKKNKKKTQVELFTKKFTTVCESLAEMRDKNSGFYWEYYVPYFVQLNETGHVETFSYLVYATSDEKDVKEWIQENETAIDEFYKWSSNYEWKALED